MAHAPDKHLVLVSFRAYPFGGGEGDLRDKARWAVAAGWRVTWVCHATGQGQHHTGPSRTATTPDGYTELLTPPVTPKTLHALLNTLAPTVVLTIGRTIGDMVGFGGAPWIAVWHYWSGLVQLGSGGNVGILRPGRPRPVPAPEYHAVLAAAARCVVVSPFMQRVAAAAGLVVPTVLPAAAGVPLGTGRPYDPADPARTWVTCVNAHTAKCGWALVGLVRHAPDVPLRILVTERDDGGGDLASDLLRALADRNAVDAAPVVITNRVEDMQGVYATSRVVFAASAAEETFGRVAAEALALGLPVVLSREGNLPFLGGPDGVYVDPAGDPAAAAATVAALYHDPASLARASALGLACSRTISRARVLPVFLSLLEDVAGKARAAAGGPPLPPLVMFFAPWHDQGLGTQVRAYCTALEAMGVRTAVLSFAPYIAETTLARTFQADPLEWVHPRVYYSPHTREQVTDAEVHACLAMWNPTAVVIPETCWHRVFEVAELVVGAGVRAVGVPNVELVRRDELADHAIFTSLVANNRQCQEVLGSHGLSTQFVGFSVRPKAALAAGAPPGPGTPVRLLLVGGNCADGRKQGPKLVKALAAAAATGAWSAEAPPVTLHITGQVEATVARTREALAAGVSPVTAAAVTITVGNLTAAEVEAAHAAADVAIMVSKHEGLGMGFYEALAAGCPILTVDAPPHREIVARGTLGWLLPAEPVPMAENPQALVTSHDVDFGALVQWLLWAADHADEIRATRASVRAHYAATHDYDAFAHRLATVVLGREPTTKPLAEPAPVAEPLASVPAPAPAPAPTVAARTVRAGKAVKVAVPAIAAKVRGPAGSVVIPIPAVAKTPAAPTAPPPLPPPAPEPLTAVPVAAAAAAAATAGRFQPPPLLLSLRNKRLVVSSPQAAPAAPAPPVGAAAIPAAFRPAGRTNAMGLKGAATRRRQ
jgi:glycosyltransferase involved in cell wall biosynthesis